MIFDLLLLANDVLLYKSFELLILNIIHFFFTNILLIKNIMLFKKSNNDLIYEFYFYLYTDHL